MLLSFCIWPCASVGVFIVASFVCLAAPRNMEWLLRQWVAPCLSTFGSAHGDGAAAGGREEVAQPPSGSGEG